MSAQDMDTLMEMGFTKEKAAEALSATGNQGIERAMDWLIKQQEECENLENASDSVSNMTADSIKKEEVQSSECPAESAKSVKCNECGALLFSEVEIELHAVRFKHSNFSESTEEKKVLTEEEKKEQLKKLEEKMKQKRLEREEREKREALEREKTRIRSGKEITAARKKLEDAEMKKLVEQRKREKLEEKLARQRVKDQIEQDKIARRAKFGMALSSEAAATASSPVSPTTPSPPQAQPPTQKDYSEAKLQIRLTNGQTLTQTFGAKEQLSAVRLFVELNRTDGQGPFSLMTNFPKKVFTDDDYNLPLESLGLVPSAVVIVSRAQR